MGARFAVGPQRLWVKRANADCSSVGFFDCSHTCGAHWQSLSGYEWLALRATDTQVRKFLKGWELPKIDELLNTLALKDAFKEGRLSLIKKRNWKALCGYTHTGGIHVQRWNTSDGIEANYSTAELLEALRFAEIIATLSVLGVLSLADDTETSEKLLERFKAKVK